MPFGLLKTVGTWGEFLIFSQIFCSLRYWERRCQLSFWLFFLQAIFNQVQFQTQVSMRNPCALIYWKNAPANIMNVQGHQSTFCRGMGVLSVWQTGPSLPLLAWFWDEAEELGLSCLSPGLKDVLEPMPPTWHKAHSERFKSKRSSLAQAIPPEDDSGTDRSVNVTKPTDSLWGDSAPTSAHPSLGKQNKLEDEQEDQGRDKCWLQFRSGPAINCIPLPSPGRNMPELGVFVQDPCAEHSREAAQGCERRWWFLKTRFTGMNTYDHICRVLPILSLPETGTPLRRIWIFSRKSCLPVWLFALNWEMEMTTQLMEDRASCSP